jgi:hypothetical protein
MQLIPDQPQIVLRSGRLWISITKEYRTGIRHLGHQDRRVITHHHLVEHDRRIVAMIGFQHQLRRQPLTIEKNHE